MTTLNTNSNLGNFIGLETNRGSLKEGSGYRIEYSFFIILPNTFAKNLIIWCEENCIGKYFIGDYFIEFENKEDATLFKLLF